MRSRYSAGFSFYHGATEGALVTLKCRILLSKDFLSLHWSSTFLSLLMFSNYLSPWVYKFQECSYMIANSKLVFFLLTSAVTPQRTSWWNDISFFQTKSQILGGTFCHYRCFVKIADSFHTITPMAINYYIKMFVLECSSKYSIKIWNGFYCQYFTKLILI